MAVLTVLVWVAGLADRQGMPVTLTASRKFPAPAMPLDVLIAATWNRVVVWPAGTV